MKQVAANWIMLLHGFIKQRWLHTLKWWLTPRVHSMVTLTCDSWVSDLASDYGPLALAVPTALRLSNKPQRTPTIRSSLALQSRYVSMENLFTYSSDLWRPMSCRIRTWKTFFIMIVAFNLQKRFYRQFYRDFIILTAGRHMKGLSKTNISGWWGSLSKNWTPHTHSLLSIKHI